ncbi:MAG: 16S rRNA (guanine(527)-N(7))-methyltransferase RsmG [Rickettsiales bacterium]|nr:16S rRNA (guanine(527)-N(7))-methyltransferase RsmG [Rickettsiales bacterium]OUV82630.1 MAG: 16S rRNA (guanine(527)-N(7))-methyltransferase RsmG [Rickettsiales bacterium TMED131]
MLDSENKDIDAFRKLTNADAYKIQNIKIFIKTLDVYQERMNLIGKSTRNKIWNRHILDSAQISDYLHKEKSNNMTIDVGSGAGFPGLILSILGRKDIILCEKSKKKSTFLRAVSQELKLKIKIFEGRIEDYDGKNVKTIISRAFSPLKNFLVKVKHLICYDTVLVLHKGERYVQEIEEAKNSFSFNYKCYKSLTSRDSRVLKIKNVEAPYARN